MLPRRHNARRLATLQAAAAALALLLTAGAQSAPQSGALAAGAAISARQARDILNGLPACSGLLDSPLRGTEVAPYMQAMGREGVSRALVVVQAPPGLLRAGERNIFYFEHLDGGGGSIRAGEQLRRITRSGLVSDLSMAARAAVRSMPPGTGLLDYYLGVWLFAQPLVAPLSGPYDVGMHTPLSLAIELGDTARVRKALIGARRAPSPLLSEDLESAFLSPYDNRAVVRALIAAGADPNAPTDDPEEPTPLMVLLRAIPRASPCNLVPLIAAGAKLDVRTDSGLGPLDLARRSGDAFAIRTIKAALRRGHDRH